MVLEGKVNERVVKVLFDVKEEPVGRMVDNQFVPIPGKKGLIRADTNETIGIVSQSKYQLVKNSEVIEKLDGIFDRAGIKYEFGNTYEFNRGSRTMMEYIFPELLIADKELHLRGYVTNDFTGQGSVVLEVGAYRFVCSNGMFVGNKEFKMPIRHFKGADEKLVEKFSEFVQTKYSDTSKFVEMLKQKELSQHQVAEYLTNEDVLSKRYQEKGVEAWNNEYSGSMNAWQVYNAVTATITHVAKASMFNKVTMYKSASREILKYVA